MNWAMMGINYKDDGGIWDCCPFFQALMNCLIQISHRREPVMLDSMLDLGWERSFLTLLEVA